MGEMLKKVTAGLLVCLPIAFFVVAFKEHAKPSAEDREVAKPVEPPDPERQRRCDLVLEELKGKNSPIWRTWERRNDIVDVKVRNGFYFADFDDKQFFDSTVRCSASEGRSGSQGGALVRYLDAESGTQVAQWERNTGFTLTDRLP